VEQTDNSKLKQNDSIGKDQSHQVSYLRFFAMIGTSMVIMYLLTYLNSYQIIEHAHFSETRLFMSLLMGGAMMAIMLFFMLGMYKNSRANVAIFVGAGLLMLLSLWLVRSQVTVTGVDYMEAMIPHHSIAILTSERAGIEDPRVRELADEIIEAQRREIKEMEWLIEDIQSNGVAETEEEAAARPVPQFAGSSE
jgi:FlaA1/EpsC-like NDP-sugar epimerase